VGDVKRTLQGLLVGALALALTACGDRSPDAGTAAQHAKAIEKAGVEASKLAPGANVTLKADAKGCKDRAKAEELVAAAKLDDPSKMIELWSAGMQDRTCRGFTGGLAVAVERVEGGWACVLPGDEPNNKPCFWIPADAI
jgi:hypothetical protein